jgi:hypothetical protein
MIAIARSFSAASFHFLSLLGVEDMAAKCSLTVSDAVSELVFRNRALWRRCKDEENGHINENLLDDYVLLVLWRFSRKTAFWSDETTN